VKTCRTILAAAAIAALAGNASLAQHRAVKSAPGHGAAQHQSSALGGSEGAANPGNIAAHAASESDKSAGHSPLPAMVNGVANKTGGGEVGHNAGPKAAGAAGNTGAALQSIDLAGPGDGSASLRRRAMRSSLIAGAAKKIPTIVPPGNVVVHAPTSSPAMPAEIARNAIGITAPSTGIRNLGVAHPSSGIAAAGGSLAGGSLTSGILARTSIGGNAGQVRHDDPRPVPMASAIHSTGLSGTTMGHPAVNAAALGGPARIVSGIGGGSMRPKY
jgi:hypothetical protein